LSGPLNMRLRSTLSVRLTRSVKCFWQRLVLVCLLILENVSAAVVVLFAGESLAHPLVALAPADCVKEVTFGRPLDAPSYCHSTYRFEKQLAKKVEKCC